MVDVYLMEREVFLLKTWILYEKDGSFVSFGHGLETNPLYQSPDVREMLVKGAKNQEMPFLFRDEFEVYFACIRDKAEGGFYLIGPMPTQYMDKLARHKFFKMHRIHEDLEKNLPVHSVEEILVAVCTLNYLVNGEQLKDRELVNANGLNLISRQSEALDTLRFDLKTEKDEEIEYRHTFQEEREMMNQIREGNVEEALRLSTMMEKDVGKLGKKELEHWRNFLIIASTLTARAAIDGGLAPAIAYRISGYYINEANQCSDVLQLVAYKRHMTETLVRLVAEQRTKRHTSSYTEQCRDYVRQHFKEKIYLEEIAGILKISPSYLSRLFKEETGQNLQDYITDVRVERAANLLLYSEESIARIAEYVNFPSQSYFGKVFKARKNMTPRQYRETYKPSEFIDNHSH